MLQTAAPFRKLAPDEHVSGTEPASENVSLQIPFTCPTPAIVSGHATKPSCFAHFTCDTVHNPLRLPCETTSERPKVLQTHQFSTLLTWKCPSRHKGVHFFDMSTCKSGPTLRCFAHFDLEMCFAPLPRALFKHLNLQKCSERGLLSTFWLGNVLHTTTACTFSTCQLAKVVRHWGVLRTLTWKCASRHYLVPFLNISTSKVLWTWSAFYILTRKRASHHNGVHFFDMSTCKSGPTLRCFAHFDLEMCFAPLPCALFKHLNFQNCSERGLLSTFWLGNVLRASTACTFLTIFDISTSKSAPNMKCFVHFDLEMWWHVLRATMACNFSSLIWPHGSAPAALASLLFGDSGATNHWKNRVFRDFPTFSRTWIFFLLRLSLFWSSFFFSLLWLFPSLLFICLYCWKFDF